MVQNPRLMLEYAGVGYEDRRMIMPKPEWLQKKHSLGFDFPNLPYYQVLWLWLWYFVFLLPKGGGTEAYSAHGHYETFSKKV